MMLLLWKENFGVIVRVLCCECVEVISYSSSNQFYSVALKYLYCKRDCLKEIGCLGRPCKENEDLL